MGRYFVGVQVPQSTCGETLVQLIRRLDPLVLAKKWYKPAQFHLTTHFLGELDEAQVQEVLRLVTPLTAEHSPFALRLARIGWFPHAKVVWCGVEGDTESLQSLQQAVAESLAAVGAARFAHDRYRPHITLGRLQTVDPSFRPDEVEVADLLQTQEAGAAGVTWRVDALHLFESVSDPTSRTGPSYPIRHTFSFS